MKNRDSAPRIVWFTLAVIVGVVGLGFVPQFSLFGMTIERVDILSELRDGAADELVEYEADIERLEQELAAMSVVEEVVVEQDTLPELPPVRYEWVADEVEPLEVRPLSSEALRGALSDAVVHIEDFDTLATTRLEQFYDKLASGESVRIAFMGDSFVEGDILTSDLRAELQGLFGGRGVGFVACDIPFATVRKTVKRTSSAWSAYSVMKPKSVPQDMADKFFVSGYLAKGGVGATTRWQTTDAFPTLDSCTRARVLLYSRDTSVVELMLNDSIPHSVEVAADERLREIYVEAENIASLRVKVAKGNILCYGVSLESEGGVAVDNFSVRSNNGHAIFGTGAAINRQAHDMLGYDLVVLQYGLNIMQKGQRGYSNYRTQLCNMIAYAERCFPGAAILVMGVSDRWVRSDESGSYVPIGSVDALTSYQRAAADSTKVAFWNTSQAMAALGGMPAFVANGWAANDYTHINFKGGRKVAEAMVAAIVEPVYDILVQREEESARLDAMRRAKALEAERRLDAQMKMVMSVADTLFAVEESGDEVMEDSAEELSEAVSDNGEE